ncbi:MAG: squalene/phytoene synthase family protein [Mariprofundaceae bacterium]|nr:squalene/phytoene synthase family protein [Mariprofundaceae bacterium]
MNSNRYCEDLIRTSYPYFFYALFTLPEKKRRAHMATLSLYHDITSITQNTSETHVSQQRLSFWHEELSRFAQQKSRHPITLELQHVVQDKATFKNILQPLLKGCHMDIFPKPILNTADFQASSQQHMLPLQQCLLHLNAYPHDHTTTFLAPLALAWQYMHSLNQLPLDLIRKRLLLPQEDRIRFHINDTQFFNATLNNNTEKLFKDYQQRIQDLCQQAVNEIPNQHRAKLTPLLSMTSLYQQHWQRICLNPFEKHTATLPIKMIWCAWRSQRREKKIIKKARA